MPRKKGPKYYAVRVGRVPGIYDSWEKCKRQVDGYSKPAFKSFFSQAEAEDFISASNQPVQVAAESTATKGKTSKTTSAPNKTAAQQPSGPLDPALTYCLEFDGGARDNASTSRLAGCGALIAEQGSDAEVGKIALHLGSYTNNQAEYAGLVLGLEAAHCLGARKIKAFGDSKLVVNQVGGKWQVKEPGLMGLHARAVAAYGCFESITLQHVLREFNKRADALANLAMDGKGWTGVVDAQGKRLADFDTRSILETADARPVVVDAPKRPLGPAKASPRKRQRTGDRSRTSPPSAIRVQE
ncbi:hypothetical protein WJX74_007515 [Apatococcus lobatus]|uniref:Ribonuclease H n=1 Tax=Apatococcus lobatus TaxID=904363 RepID=A0AAW1SFP1_9CHLO